MRVLRAVLGIAVIVGVIWVGVELVPPYFNNYQFQDAVTSEARINTYTQKTETEMRDYIYKKAIEYNIPVTHDQIKVSREGQSVAISVDYTVHVELPGYPMDLQFHTASKNKSF